MYGMNLHASKVIDALGGTAEVARMFGVRMPSVSGWRTEGIPKARMMYIKWHIPLRLMVWIPTSPPPNALLRSPLIDVTDRVQP